MIDFLMSFSSDFWFATGLFTVGILFTAAVSEGNTLWMYDRQNGTDMYKSEIFDDIGVSMEDRIAMSKARGDV